MKNLNLFLMVGFCAAFLLVPQYAFADFDSSMRAIQDTVFHRILPVVAVLGICFAGFSLITGNPNGKLHLVSAILGSIICFGAQAIIDLLSGLIR